MDGSCARLQQAGKCTLPHVDLSVRREGSRRSVAGSLERRDRLRRQPINLCCEILSREALRDESQPSLRGHRSHLWRWSDEQPQPGLDIIEELVGQCPRVVEVHWWQEVDSHVETV